MKRYFALLALVACQSVSEVTSDSVEREESEGAADRPGEIGERERPRIGAMAPLIVGRFDAPHDPSQENEWRSFREDLTQAKARGIDFVSFDVWWSVVEREGDQVFDFTWVDRMISEITAVGLRFRPVLAFHACGGNVGDDCDIPLPAWLPRIPEVQILAPSDLYFVSAQGHMSREVVSVWATPYVVDEYREFVRAFVQRYDNIAAQSEGIVVGLGPASELRFPSYNSHDVGAGYPSNGVVQAYGPLAQADFAAWAMARHGSLATINRLWDTHFQTVDDIEWPEATELGNFLAQKRHLETEYGRDMFDWYQSSLLDHGHIVLDATASEINATAFRDRTISARVPGVHWRSADSRGAELAAGMLNTRTRATWQSDRGAHGYTDLLRLFADLRAEHPNISVDYTCLEMGNDEGGSYAGSRAEDLVFWFAAGAASFGIPVGGENALSSGLWSPRGWDRLRNAVEWSHYETLTLLRLTDVVRSPYAREGLSRL